MRLFQVPVSHVGQAWADGAQSLGEATARAEREITASQLKMLLLRGERTLIGVADDSDTPKAWAAVQVQTLPNIRILFIYAAWGPGFAKPAVMDLLVQYARDNGCESIRCSSIDSIGEIWERKLKAKKIYSTYEFEMN
jgi:hypothetical protein